MTFTNIIALPTLALLLTPTLTAQLAARGQESGYLLGAGDQITVHCLNTEELPQTPVRIDADGTIPIPFAGRVKVAGLPVDAAEKKLAGALSTVIVKPECSVNIAESHSQPVSVFGAVNTPGAYQLGGNKSLTEVLSMAGGLKKDAGPLIRITRGVKEGALPLPGAGKDSTGEFTVASVYIDDLMRGDSPGLNIEIKPYDVIAVPEAALIYVVGEVHKPGGFIMTGRGGLTILQAVAMAEGLDRTAAPRKVRILRKNPDSTHTEIAVNVDNILAGRAEDLTLRADDVLFVPSNTAKSVGIRSVDAIIQLATGVVVYGRY